MDKEKDLFIGIENPHDLRKNLLESSRTTISSLQRFEKINHIRSEKLANMQKLKTLVHEINFLIDGIRKDLPVSKLTNKKTKKPKKETKSKIDKLDEDLSIIEAKLQQLS